MSFDGGVWAVDDFTFDKKKESDIVNLIKLGLIK